MTYDKRELALRLDNAIHRTIHVPYTVVGELRRLAAQARDVLLEETDGVGPISLAQQPRPKECAAVQHADRTICERCSMQWDTNDPNPPVCRAEGQGVLLP